ncbi:MAG: hypothetical protein COA79_03960 [Planctomycetota bacterium]|nr:MAG: hypothetical protein COA79_03960 [Planctomycetota bacterium]
MKRINIYSYTNYRLFLKDYLEYKRFKEPEYSYRKFCKIAGIVSPSFLKHVIDGVRNLSKDGAKKFMIGFGIEGPEASFFEILVLMNQAKDIDQRNKYYSRLKKFNGFKESCSLESDGFDYYKKWYHPVVRELVGMAEDGKATAAWIVTKVNPKISKKDAQESLDLLVRLELLEKTTVGYHKKHNVVKGFAGLKSMMLHNYHKEMIRLGGESVERYKKDVRNVTSVTLSVPENRIQEIQDKIARFREELLQMAVDTKDPERVIQVNIQEFPLTKSVKKKGKK